MTLNLIFTLDYEIHGNGDGSPLELMVKPTYRLMNLLEQYNAKLTILADVAEILSFKKYFEETGEDRFNYKDIELQLKDAIRRGHDVQLHIHSSYFNAQFNGLTWDQCWEEYNMAALTYERIYEMIYACKSFLENLLKPVSDNYSCTVFRAANWSMMPTQNIYKALVENGIIIDTSVYKGGRQSGNVAYDYSTAHSHLFPYLADENDINNEDKNGRLYEFPIYTEQRYFWSFITPIRLFRMFRAKFHRHKIIQSTDLKMERNDNSRLNLQAFFRKSPWKLDFNQASGIQLINALKRIVSQSSQMDTSVEVVLIGHSKTFIHYNEVMFKMFLKWVSNVNGVGFHLFPKEINK